MWRAQRRSRWRLGCRPPMASKAKTGPPPILQYPDMLTSIAQALNVRTQTSYFVKASPGQIQINSLPQPIHKAHRARIFLRLVDSSWQDLSCMNRWPKKLVLRGKDHTGSKKRLRLILEIHGPLNPVGWWILPFPCALPPEIVSGLLCLSDWLPRVPDAG